MKRESFLLFVPAEVVILSGASTTLRLDVQIKRTQERIGLIAWRPEWRQYAFTPQPRGAYTRTTMQLIARKMGRLTKQWLDRKQAADPTFTPTRGAPKPKPVRHTRPGRPMLEHGL